MASGQVHAWPRYTHYLLKSTLGELKSQSWMPVTVSAVRLCNNSFYLGA